jgi:hypothetical protein
MITMHRGEPTPEGQPTETCPNMIHPVKPSCLPSLSAGKATAHFFSRRVSGVRPRGAAVTMAEHPRGRRDITDRLRRTKAGDPAVTERQRI